MSSNESCEEMPKLLGHLAARGDGVADLCNFVHRRISRERAIAGARLQRTLLRERDDQVYVSKVVIGTKIELSRDCPKKFPSGSITPITRNGFPLIRTSLLTGSS